MNPRPNILDDAAKENAAECAAAVPFSSSR